MKMKYLQYIYDIIFNLFLTSAKEVLFKKEKMD